MADDLNKRGSADRSRVNVNEDFELAYWMKKWNCTETQLRAAVKAVGVMAHDVQKYLGR